MITHHSNTQQQTYYYSLHQDYVAHKQHMIDGGWEVVSTCNGTFPYGGKLYHYVATYSKEDVIDTHHKLRELINS